LILATNILINTKNFKIKLIDYDLSQNVIFGEKSKFYGGTKLFYSPEIIRKLRYSLEKNSVWQLGCLLYLLYFHRYPFHNMGQILYNTIEKDLEQYDLSKYPPKGIELLIQMLSKGAMDRPSLHEIEYFDFKDSV
jgi:serine/threonine protein kinase